MKQQLKGYMDFSNCVMTNRPFKYIEHQEDKVKIPQNLKFNTELTFNVKTLFFTLRYLRLLKIESVRFSNTDTKFIIEATDELNNIKVELPLISDDYPQELKESSCKYSVNYLYDLLREYKQIELIECTLKYGDDYPLKIFLNFNKDWGILAPRIENN